VEGEEDTVLGLELRWYVALKVIDDRAGRFRAWAALCNNGELVEEKL
jgi:hypothetical protein